MDKRTKLWTLLGIGALLLAVGLFEYGANKRRWIHELNSGNADQRVVAIRGLAQDGSAQAGQAIAEHISDPDASVASHALLALGTLGGPERVKQLERTVGDPRPEAREAALVALGRSSANTPVDHQVLARSVQNDAEPYVRAAAAQALGLRGAKDTVPTLIAALRDPDVDVRQRAAEALRRIAKQRLYFPPGAPVEDRERAIAGIETWWQTAATRP